MAHPSKINNIEKFEFDNNRAFIYFLLEGQEVIYVGKTTSFLNRVVSHQKNEKVSKQWVDGKLQECESKLKKFDNIYMKEIHEDHLDHYEKLYIKCYTPKYNTCHMAQKIRNEIEFEKRAVNKFIIDNNLNMDIERRNDKWLIQANKKEIDSRGK
nr:hypothetical protein [uncultured Mediterranean phage uvMED]